MPDNHIIPRMHTAEHLLNQTMVRMFDCGRCVSAHLNRKKSKCDYAFSRDITDEEKAAIEERLNRLIADDLEVREEVLLLGDAGELCDLSRLPDESGETVRIVRIGDYDLCPCIGEHVRSTGELGRFRITTHDWNEGIVRLRFKLDEND